MKKPSSFGIWGNTEKDSFWETLPHILNWSKEKGLTVHLTKHIVGKEKGRRYNQSLIRSKEDITELDFMLVLGGDGTFLSCIRAVEHRATPVLGIHLGDLGFLAKVTLKDLFQRLDQMATGSFKIEQRTMAKAVISKNGAKRKHNGLNDFVVSNGESHRMLNTQVHVNDQLVANYKSDGLIIATPTGSTAYSLSSGGPIITPDVDSFVITPISPHSLTSRPLVVPADSEIEIDFPGEEEKIKFITDGQIHETLDPTCSITITRAEFEIGLIDFLDNDYFQTLRTKMGWGKRGEH